MKQKIKPMTNFFFLILFLISYAKTDIPVHCLVNQIKGDWIFRINNEKFDAKPEDYRTTCGHGLPNKVDQTIGEKEFSWSKYHDLELTLGGDYIIYEKGQIAGHWTPVYDQSFVVYYKQSILTAPYKYFKNSSGNFQSNCSKSMIGWYIPYNKLNTMNWSCFFAFKKGTDTKSFLQVEEKVTATKGQISLAQIQRTQRLHNSLKYEHFEHMVNEINQANLSWTATVHNEYRGLSLIELRESLGLRKKSGEVEFNLENNSGDHFRNSNSPQTTTNLAEVSKSGNTMENELDEFMKNLSKEEETIENLNPNEKNETKVSSNESGKKYSKNNSLDAENKIKNSKREKDSRKVTDYKETSKYLHTPLEEMDEETLPRNWDWRDVGGVNYVPSIKSQGSCGSCYIFATVTCLETRLRIQTNNKDKTEFSKQYPLSCNFYSEGCHGGYPFFVGKFFKEFQLVPETCFPYTATTNNCSTVCDYSKFDKQYKVSHYGYLGGYYGASNEILMMKELRARGPIPGNMLVPLTFHYYKHGVYSASGLKKNADKLSKTTMVDRNLSWEQVQHSITIVGYGEEKGVKYWIGMNTWGTSFGEQGFFKILRGENECSIESMGDVVQIEVTERK
jgi:C1A family cysteine protease